MPSSTIDQFMNLGQQDTALQKQLESFKQVTDPEGATAYFQGLVQEGQQRGLNFTHSDLLQWFQARLSRMESGELEDADLEAVSGGTAESAIASLQATINNIKKPDTSQMHAQLERLNQQQSLNYYLISQMNTAASAAMKLFR